jgi:hypothetical protein
MLLNLSRELRLTPLGYDTIPDWQVQSNVAASARILARVNADLTQWLEQA